MNFLNRRFAAPVQPEKRCYTFSVKRSRCGKISLDSAGNPICILETTEVAIRRL